MLQAIRIAGPNEVSLGAVIWQSRTDWAEFPTHSTAFWKHVLPIFLGANISRYELESLHDTTEVATA